MAVTLVSTGIQFPDSTIQTTSALVSGNFTGAVSLFAMTGAPAGWLKANGAWVSRSSYAALFAAIGTTFGAGDGSSSFALPDLRGEFLRGWDDARGLDTSRGFGSVQSGQNLAHRHYTTLDGNAATNGTWESQIGRTTYSSVIGGYETYHARGVADSTEANASTSNTSGGSEVRPRNIALLICIKF